VGVVVVVVVVVVAPQEFYKEYQLPEADPKELAAMSKEVRVDRSIDRSAPLPPLACWVARMASHPSLA
jgi:hypothetical protein